MKEGLIYFILSIGFTLILFFIDKYLVWKGNKTSNISFIENKCKKLFVPLYDETDVLKAEHEKNLIKENSYFYQATLYNSGASDIPQISIYKPLSLKLPKQYKWNSFKIYDISDGLSIKSDIDNNNLLIEWDLFKKQEFFRFDAVIETNDEINNPIESGTKEDNKNIKSFSNKITFSDSRIINLQISKHNIRSYERFLRWGKTTIWIILIIYFTNKEILSNKVFSTILLIIIPIMFFFMFEQLRMRKKREKMNLISSGSWNIYKEEDC